MTPLLRLTDVHRNFGRTAALSGVSLDLFSDDRVIVLGANGSGKSTLLKIIAAALRPAIGERAVESKNTTCGYLGHHSGLYSGLTIRENLEFYQNLSGASYRIADGITAWGLDESADKQFEVLSKGQQAKAAILRVLLANPKLLVLDEPSANLDDKSVEFLVRSLEARENTTALVVATHDLARVLPLASRVIVMERGKVVADSRVSESIEAVVAIYQRMNR